MASYKCSNCNKELTGGNMQSCSHCGQIMCSDCSGRNTNLCSTCYSEMKYLQ